MIGTMLQQQFEALDQLLKSGGCASGLDFLIEQFRSQREVRILFEALLMKARLNLQLPLIQTESSTEFPSDVRGAYDQAMIEAAREAGRLALDNGDIVQAWPYFRAIGEPGPVADAISQVEPGEASEQVINIAFAEGAHPAKGLELILRERGMCQAITAFGMYAVQNRREECIGLLVRALHTELLERMLRTIEAQEGIRPQAGRVADLLPERDWMFGEYDYYVDTSHLMSLLSYSLEVKDRHTLELFHDLCLYGQRLSAMFQSRGQAPFENPFVDYDQYVLAMLGDEVDRRIDHFRRKADDSDQEEAGTAPAQLLVNLLVRLGRFEEALAVSLQHLDAEDPLQLSCPPALQLCHMAGDYERLKKLARERGDLLSYAAASALHQLQLNPERCVNQDTAE